MVFSHLKSLEDLLEILGLDNCNKASGFVSGYFYA